MYPPTQASKKALWNRLRKDKIPKETKNDMITMVKTGEIPKYCPYCGAIIKRKDWMKKHMKNHLGENK